MTRRTRLAVGLSAAVLLGLGVGCAAKAPVSLSGDAVVLKMDKRDYRLTGTGQGKDCKPVFLRLLQFEAPSYGVAEQQALSASGGVHLIHKRLYEGVENDFFIFANHCRWVEGTGARY